MDAHLLLLVDYWTSNGSFSIEVSMMCLIYMGVGRRGKQRDVSSRILKLLRQRVCIS